MSPTRAAFVVFMPVMTYPTWPVHKRPVDTGSGARTPICRELPCCQHSAQTSLGVIKVLAEFQTSACTQYLCICMALCEQDAAWISKTCAAARVKGQVAPKCHLSPLSCCLEKHKLCCSSQPCSMGCVKLLTMLQGWFTTSMQGNVELTSVTSYVSPEAREATLSPVCRLPSTTSTRQITPLHRDRG